MSSETKIVYYIDDEETPYLVKIPIPLDDITLADFKNVLNRPNYKFFFKAMDADFGVVKEEIVDDGAKLPAIKGRVVSWLVTAEGSQASEGANSTDAAKKQHAHHDSDTESEVGLGGTSRKSRRGMLPPLAKGGLRNGNKQPHPHYYPGGPSHHSSKMPPPLLGGYDSSSVMTSDLESSTVLDSDEDDATSRLSTTTEESSVSRVYARNMRRRRRKKHAGNGHHGDLMSRTSSISSITDSTMSLNIITVTLNLNQVNFLGISIVGQSNKGGDGGIYVGSIMKGGAVALDGRIEPGDMILQVNDVNFEKMSNDDAVKVLRDAVQKPGPIKLVVAKCFDPQPSKGYFTIPRTEAVRPIDPGAWVAHTEAALQGGAEPPLPLRPPSASTLTSSSLPSLPDTEHGGGGPFGDCHPLIPLSVDATSMPHIVQVMASPDSGLDVRDRMWLKITFKNAFLGSDVVEWLINHVHGFHDRKEAKKYAAQMLKDGFIKHTVNKSSFSEQCYYVFSEDVTATMNNLRLSESAPLPPSSGGELNPLGAWGGGSPAMPPYSGQYMPMQPPFLPPFPQLHNTPPQAPTSFGPASLGQHSAPAAVQTNGPNNETVSYVNFGRDGSVHSAGSGGSNDHIHRHLHHHHHHMMTSQNGGGQNGAVTVAGGQLHQPLLLGNDEHSSSSQSGSSSQSESEETSRDLLATPNEPPSTTHISGEYQYSDKGVV